MEAFVSHGHGRAQDHTCQRNSQHQRLPIDWPSKAAARLLNKHWERIDISGTSDTVG